MARSKSEEPATPTRIWSKTIRLLRILAAAESKSMAEFIHELAADACKTRGPLIARELTRLEADEPAPTTRKGRQPG